MTYKTVLVEEHSQSGLGFRLHQRVVDPEVRHRRHLPVPSAQTHGRGPATPWPTPTDVEKSRGRRCAGRLVGRLRAALQGQHAAPGIEAPVEDSHALREGLQDASQDSVNDVALVFGVTAVAGAAA